MDEIQIIEGLISEGKLDEAIHKLDLMIVKHPQDARLWYLRGKTYWRKGETRNAIPDFQEAAHLDPDSPAVHALEMAEDIRDYFNPDLLNP